jgi:hypothetical protein
MNDLTKHKSIGFAIFSLYIGSIMVYSNLFSSQIRESNTIGFLNSLFILIGILLMTYGAISLFKDIKTKFNLFRYLINLLPINKTAKEKWEFGNNTLITFNDLSKIPISEPFYINDDKNIETIRLDTKRKNSISFRVNMKGIGKKWELHKHDCKETILIYKGSLYDEVSKTYINKSEICVIPPYTSHEIVTLENTSVFYVEFDKDLLNDRIK